MADRKDYYFKQKVTEAELDAGFEGLEEADRAIMTDMGLIGVTLGTVAQRGAGANISVDVGAHLATDDAGQRLYIPSVVNQQVQTDFVAASTDVSVAGRSKIVSVFLVFQRNLSDPRLDGNSVSVFFDRAESYALVIKQGAEALSPTPPPLEAGKVLICDITRTFGQTQILTANISFARRQEMFRLIASPSGSILLTGTTQKAIAQALQDALNAHVAGTSGAHQATAVAYAGGPAWRDSTTNPATTVEAQLDKIVTDLGDPSVNGAARISSLAVSGVNVLLATGSARTQIVSLLAQLDTLWASLIATGSGVSGAVFVGAEAQGNLAVGTVKSQLGVLDTRSFQDRVSAAKNWQIATVSTSGSGGAGGDVPICCDTSGSSGVNGGDRFVAFDASAFPYTSEDGFFWTRHAGVSFGGGPGGPHDVAVGAGKFLTGSPAALDMHSSTDGITWASSGSLNSNPLSALLYVPAIFPWIAGSVSGNIDTSTDGSTWVSRIVPGGFAGKSFKQFATNGSIIVGITSSSYNKVLTSPDGINWTERTLGATQVWNCIAYDATDGIFIAAGGSGSVFKSSDGITWSAITAPNGGALSIASDGQGVWVAISNAGSYGGLAYSSDKGATWNKVHVGSHLVDPGFARVIFTQRRFVMARSHAANLEFALSMRR